MRPFALYILQTLFFPTFAFLTRASLKAYQQLSGQLPFFVYGKEAAPALQNKNLADPIVYPNRVAMLEMLPKNAICAEIGVFRGEFSRLILDKTAPRELHLFDLSFDLVAPGLLDPESAMGILKFNCGDSSSLLGRYPNDLFDWLYVDGDHSELGVSRDVQTAKIKVRPGGFLAFNDYTPFDPFSFSVYGVIQAVNRLCAEEGWQIVAFAFGDYGFNDIVVRRPLT